MYIFCFNHQNQSYLEKALKRKVSPIKAELLNHRMIYVGYSQKWRGSVSSIESSECDSIRGFVVNVSESDIQILDKQEGVIAGYCARIEVNVNTTDSAIKAYAYAATSTAKVKPSYKYIKEVFKTVSLFWPISSSNDLL